MKLFSFFDIIKNNIFKFIPYLSGLLGFSWILLYIFFRFLRSKQGFFFKDMKEHLTLIHYVLFCLFILIHLLIICSLIITIYQYLLKKKRSKWTKILSEKFKIIIDNIYWKPLENVYNMIAPHIPGSGRLFLYIIRKLNKRYDNTNLSYSLIVFFDIIPKVIIVFTFLIEIVVYNQMFYFQYVVILIIIPLIYNIFMKCFLGFSLRNMPIIKDYFVSITGVNPIFNDLGEIVQYQEYECVVKPEYIKTINPQEELALLFDLDQIRIFCLENKDHKELIMPYILFITSIIYLIGGCYRLYFFINYI